MSNKKSLFMNLSLQENQTFLKSNLLVAIIALSINLILSTSVSAAIISVDWKASGDSLITRDTVSGLNWLDLTETKQMSYNYVTAQLESGGQFEGWRYATSDEVVALWSNFNVDLSSSGATSSLSSDPNVITASQILGNNTLNGGSNYSPYSVFGLVADEYSAGYHYFMGANIRYSGETDYIIKGSSWHWDSTDVDDLGSYLVQTSVVPLPNAFLLFGSAFICLIGLAKRKKI